MPLLLMSLRLKPLRSTRRLSRWTPPSGTRGRDPGPYRSNHNYGYPSMGRDHVDTDDSTLAVEKWLCLPVTNGVLEVPLRGEGPSARAGQVRHRSTLRLTR